MKAIKVKAKSGNDTHVFKMTSDEYLSHESESMGLCLGCGAEAYGVEPDARKYNCDTCGESRVYGTPELLIMGRVGIVESVE